MAGSYPESNKKFCDKCGSETITKCPKCQAYIQGYYHVEGVLGGFTYKLPTFCHECGAPYPWTEKAPILPEKQRNIQFPKKIFGQPRGTSMTISNKVFIVHGHDEAMKEGVARYLEKLGLQPIILHEQPNKGRAIIEKLIDYSDVGFAVILLSADDIAYNRYTEKPDDAKPQARQNVILELGFFLGHLKRDRVCPMYRSAPNFRLPSDYSGVLLTEYDEAGGWREKLKLELKEAGYLRGTS
jgi:hypothetical protein